MKFPGAPAGGGCSETGTILGGQGDRVWSQEDAGGRGWLSYRVLGLRGLGLKVKLDHAK